MISGYRYITSHFFISKLHSFFMYYVPLYCLYLVGLHVVFISYSVNNKEYLATLVVFALQLLNDECATKLIYMTSDKPKSRVKSLNYLNVIHLHLSRNVRYVMMWSLSTWPYVRDISVHLEQVNFFMIIITCGHLYLVFSPWQMWDNASHLNQSIYIHIPFWYFFELLFSLQKRPFPQKVPRSN